MTATAFLVVEANAWFSSQKVNLLSIFSYSLGNWGKRTCWVTYLFLFYALLVAYVSGIGGLCHTFFKLTFQIDLPPSLGALFFVLLFGWVIYLGTRRVDLFNRGLMIGKIGFFLLLVLIGSQYIEMPLLTRSDPSYALSALPLLVIAFGFHNMIPSLSHYLKGDLKRIRVTILGGSLMVLAIYLIWELLVLGIVPLEGENGLLMSLKTDREASQSIAMILGSPWVRTFSQGLAFFALLTSFLAQALGLVHFLADGFKLSYKKEESGILCMTALLPPLILSAIYPQLFFKALNFAGGICTTILFGFLPVATIWVGRYRKKISTSYALPGGRVSLVAIFLFALLIMAVQIASMMGINTNPWK